MVELLTDRFEIDKLTATNDVFEFVNRLKEKGLML